MPRFISAELESESHPESQSMTKLKSSSDFE